MMEFLDAENIPERSVWASVLMLAIEDYKNASARLQRNRGTGYEYDSADRQQQAAKYFQRSDNRPGSYKWICNVLDLDPERVIKKLGIERERS